MPGRLDDILNEVKPHITAAGNLLGNARNLESGDANRRDLSIAITALEDAELRVLRIQARLS